MISSFQNIKLIIYNFFTAVGKVKKKKGKKKDKKKNSQRKERKATQTLAVVLGNLI